MSDATCTSNVVVGFTDGHLEATKVTWQNVKKPYQVAPFQAASASLWPWGSAAKVEDAPVGRPKLAIPPTPELANRKALPNCGDQDSCFAQAVLAGHAAEYATDDGGTDVTIETVDRFTGSGPIVQYSGELDSDGTGSWDSGTTLMVMVIGGGGVDFRSIDHFLANQ